MAFPRFAFAQQGQTKRIGYLDIFPPDDPQSMLHLAAFWEGLAPHGWTEKNVVVDYRWGANTAQKAVAAGQELIDARPDLIFVVAQVASVAPLTKAIPIIFCFTVGTVVSQIITNYARPESNISGFIITTGTDFVGKSFSLLKDIVPDVQTIGYIYNPDSTSADVTAAALVADNGFAAKLGARFVPYEVHSEADLTVAIRAFAAEPHGGLVIGTSPWMVTNRALAISEVAKAHLPAVWPEQLFARDGAMVAYAVDASKIVRAAADYAGLALNGTKVGDLPVQLAPAQLTVNLKTATALGITIPQSVLISADQVIS